MIDFWEDYDGTNSEKIPSMRGIDYERIKAYCEAIGVDMYKQSINAKFMNGMEDWYLNLAKQYSALDKIRAEIAMKKQEINFKGLGDYEKAQAEMRLSTLNGILQIIDKYKTESEE